MLTLTAFLKLRFARTAAFQPADASIVESRSAPRQPDPLTLFQQLDRWLWRQEQMGRDAYLGRAADSFDLERRIRHIDRAGAVWFG